MMWLDSWPGRHGQLHPAKLSKLLGFKYNFKYANILVMVLKCSVEIPLVVNAFRIKY